MFISQLSATHMYLHLAVTEHVAWTASRFKARMAPEKKG